jgi:predicted DNA-binding protein (MmcQ/YjbR family)
MNIDAIRAYCMNFPRATEKLQWGDDLCFKIGGKIFAIVSLDNPRLCFKCTPDVFSELIEREDIHPAPYVGRYKWVMLDRLDTASNAELEDLIQQSYAMVAAKVPKRPKSRTRLKTGKKRKPTKISKKSGSAKRKLR